MARRAYLDTSFVNAIIAKRFRQGVAMETGFFSGCRQSSVYLLDGFVFHRGAAFEALLPVGRIVSTADGTLHGQ